MEGGGARQPIGQLAWEGVRGRGVGSGKQSSETENKSLKPQEWSWISIEKLKMLTEAPERSKVMKG